MRRNIAALIPNLTPKDITWIYQVVLGSQMDGGVRRSAADIMLLDAQRVVKVFDKYISDWDKIAPRPSWDQRFLVLHEKIRKYAKDSNG